MEIEDRYGDLQAVYFESEEGDLVLDNLGSKVGIAHFDDRDFLVIEGQKSAYIEEWLTMKNGYRFDLTVLSDENCADCQKLTYRELSEKVKNATAKNIRNFRN